MRPRVLVVDDHPANTRLVAFVIEARGMDVLIAHDVPSALAILSGEVPALALVDVQLPGTDGLTLTRQLRADPRFAQMPIVAVTAYAMAHDEAAALDAGCDAFVSKPIDTKALGELALRLTGGPRA